MSNPYKSWYHDFSILGYKTPQTKRNFILNQKCKQQIIFPMIEETLKKVISDNPQKTKITVYDLFGNDAFYANYIINLSKKMFPNIDIHVFLVDNNKKPCFEQAKWITKQLGNLNSITFINDDVFNITEKVDIILCFGGLYHLRNPSDLIKKLSNHTDNLIIQTVISLVSEDLDYFISPSEWSHGSRFSHGKLLKMVTDAGWKLIESTCNILEGNVDEKDKGSIYVRCHK